jgi:hypothetical protein
MLIGVMLTVALVILMPSAFMLSAFMPSAFMLSAFMLSALMLNVVVPKKEKNI